MPLSWINKWRSISCCFVPGVSPFGRKWTVSGWFTETHLTGEQSAHCLPDSDLSTSSWWHRLGGDQLRTWASYQIRKIAGCACVGNAGSVLPATNFKGNRYLAIPACIIARASSTCRDACRDRSPVVVGETFSAFPAHAQPAILRIW